VIIILIISTAGISIAEPDIHNKSLQKNNISDNKSIDIRYNDSEVFVFGRCRSMIVFYNESEPPYYGGLYFGKLFGIYFSTCEYYDEWMLVLIRNESIKDRYLKVRGKIGIGLKNTSGIFFWGAKGFTERIIGPRIFVRCYAEKVYVTQDWEE
jgi:hypothetical protein